MENDLRSTVDPPARGRQTTPRGVEFNAGRESSTGLQVGWIAPTINTTR